MVQTIISAHQFFQLITLVNISLFVTIIVNIIPDNMSYGMLGRIVYFQESSFLSLRKAVLNLLFLGVTTQIIMPSFLL